jgi:gluconolactonase
MSVTSVNLLQLATSLPYVAEINSFTYANNTPVANVTFHAYNDTFNDLLGANASWSMIQNTTYQAFHEAGVYNNYTNTFYIASNWAGSLSNPLNVSGVNFGDFSLSEKRYPGLVSPNGGCTYDPPGSNNNGTPKYVLWCDEGDFNTASGLTLLDPVTGNVTVSQLKLPFSN